MNLRSLPARLRSLLTGLRQSASVDADMHDEFATHIALRTADLERTGMPAAEALRRARSEFGLTAKYAEQGRESRGLRWVDQFRFSLLDFKLGFRMLLRYPGLTIVAGLALTFAICVGSAAFEFLHQVANPSLDFRDGDRIVAIRNWDVAENRPQHRVAYEFSRWRTLNSIEQTSAYRASSRNLIIKGEGTPLELAEMSASAFALLQVKPLLGRTLLASDERGDAPPVAVIGYDVWQGVFAGDASIVGRVVQFGKEATTIIGVMPEGFAFPIAQSIWTPLKFSSSDFEPGAGPSVRIFGKIASHSSIDEAQVELDAVGQQLSRDNPRTHEHARPQVMKYTRSILDISGWNAAAVMSSNVFLVLLVGLVCANVALLMFARAATRESEMAVRAALGASRGRIVGQLFVEAVVLGAVASVVGLAISKFAMQWGVNMVSAELSTSGMKLPFWIKGDLSLLTVAYAAGLTIFGAVIAGILPALKVTRGLGARLKSAAPGAGGLKFGGVWTAVIVAQVAVTVLFPAVSFLVRRDSQVIQHRPVGFASNEFLATRLDIDRANQFTDSLAQLPALSPALRYNTLKDRLLSDAAISGVTFATRLPRMYHPWNQVESEGARAPRDSTRGHRVARVGIAPDYFDVLGVSLLQGREFALSDAESGIRVAIVNKTFVDSVFGGRNPIGHRLRFVGSEARVKLTAADSAWIEIVGVAPDMGTVSGYGEAGVYEPIRTPGAFPVEMAVHLKSNAAASIPRVRAMATLHDPDLRLHELQMLDGVVDAEVQFYDFWIKVTMMLSGVAILLSLAAIYSVMAFSVSRRTREIGIRIALGSSVRGITAVIFRKPLTQVGIGIAVGSCLVVLVNSASQARLPSAAQMGATAAYVFVMAIVCALACIVPIRRALQVQPTEALRSDG